MPARPILVLRQPGSSAWRWHRSAILSPAFAAGTVWSVCGPVPAGATAASFRGRSRCRSGAGRRPTTRPIRRPGPAAAIPRDAVPTGRSRGCAGVAPGPRPGSAWLVERWRVGSGWAATWERMGHSMRGGRVVQGERLGRNLSGNAWTLVSFLIVFFWFWLIGWLVFQVTSLILGLVGWVGLLVQLVWVGCYLSLVGLLSG